MKIICSLYSFLLFQIEVALLKNSKAGFYVEVTRPQYWALWIVGMQKLFQIISNKVN